MGNSRETEKARLWERDNTQYGGKEIKTTVYCSFYWFIQNYMFYRLQKCLIRQQTSHLEVNHLLITCRRIWETELNGESRL